MRTGTLSCITHRRNRLSFAHALAFVDEDFGQMGILSFDLLAVVQNYFAELAVDGLHNRVSGRLDRSSHRLGNIHPGMVLHLARPGEGRIPTPETTAPF